MSRNHKDFIEAYVQYTQNQEAPERVHRWVAISLIAAALQRKVYLPRGHYTLFANLYILIIGKSGQIRKSTSTRIGIDLLKQLNNFPVMSERLTAASLIQQLERSKRTYFEKGLEKTQSATFSYSSEFKVLMEEVSGSITSLLTDFYDCAPHDATKPWIYETKSEGEKKIYGPCLNLLGCSTPTWLRDCISVSQLEGGFASRIIFIVANKPERFFAWPQKQINERKIIEDLKDIYNAVGEVKVSDPTREWFEQWYMKHQKSLPHIEDLRFAGYYGRKGDTLLKIAMVCMMSRGESLWLQPEDLERASLLLESAEEQMFEAFGAAGRSELSQSTYDVMSVLKIRKTITHRELMKLFWKDITPRELQEVMKLMFQMGAINEPEITKENITYRLNSSYGDKVDNVDIPLVPPSEPQCAPRLPGLL